jgi:hypothetical protein
VDSVSPVASVALTAPTINEKEPIFGVDRGLSGLFGL